MTETINKVLSNERVGWENKLRENKSYAVENVEASHGQIATTTDYRHVTIPIRFLSRGSL